MKKSKILLVDDDPKLTALVRLLLVRLGGYEVREENRSFAALETAQEFRPDLVILDLTMPGKDGGDVAAEFRNDPRLANIPVIFLSSLVTSRDCGSRGGRHMLSKPVDPHALLSLVDSILLVKAA